MKKTAYTRFFWSDWIADTSHLDLMQLGAYMRLLEFIYQHAKPLPGDLDKIYRICHATSPTEQTAIRQILHEYFKPFEDPEHGPQFRHFRAERELEWALLASEKNSERARKAAEARWNAPSNAPSIRQAMLNECHPEPEPESSSLRSEDITHRSSDESPKNEFSGRAKPAKTPFSEIWNLWRETLPELPAPHSPEHWTPARKAQIRARWNDQLPDLDSWRQCFELVRKSPFLMGKVNPTPGRRPFRADLFWVTKPENLLKIYEGKYHA